MKTKKMSVKELKGLGTFTAISATGKNANFTIEGEVAVDENGKNVKLDTIRRAWSVVVEDFNSWEEKSLENESKFLGSKVQMENGTEGTVVGIMNNLATIERNGDEFPAPLETLTILDSSPTTEEVVSEKVIELAETVEDALEVNNVEAPKKPKAPKKPRVVKDETSAKNTRANRYAQIVKTTEPFEVNLLENQSKSLFKVENEDHVTLEYTTGTFNEGEKEHVWEVLRCYYPKSKHGIFFKLDGEIIHEATVGGKFVKQMRLTKHAVRGYLQENFNVTVAL